MSGPSGEGRLGPKPRVCPSPSPLGTYRVIFRWYQVPNWVKAGLLSKVHEMSVCCPLSPPLLLQASMRWVAMKVKDERMKCLEEQTPWASPASLATDLQHSSIFCPCKWFPGPQTHRLFQSSVV